ncbi:hypothetical protein HMPREF1584_01058, partial [Gardnerella vaginalis JCP8481A]
GKPGDHKGEKPSKPGKPSKPSKPSKPGDHKGKKPSKPGKKPAPAPKPTPKKPETKDESTQTDSAPLPPASTVKFTKNLIALDTKEIVAGKEQSVYVSGKPAALKNAKKDARMYAFIYSTPQQLNGEDGHEYVTVRADENGKYYFKAMIPAGLTGKHTILLMDAGGSQLASGEVTVFAAHVADADTQSDNMPAPKKPAPKK